MNHKNLTRPGAVTAAALFIGTLACGASADGEDAVASAVGVSVEPPAATLRPGASLAFSATVTGSTDAGVTWSVVPGACGGITQAGVFTAPSAAATCEVRATSNADPARSGAAVVTVSGAEPASPTFRVELAPQAGVSGLQRVNFAVPLPPGALHDATRIRAKTVPAAAELAAAHRPLASWPDGSLRAVQIQVEVDVSTTTALDVEVGVGGSVAQLSLVAVTSTLLTSDGTLGPRVWARLPPEWLAASGIAGPLVARSALTEAEADAWLGICDYATWNVDAFLAAAADRGAWLYDRPTAMYRGYAMTGSMDALESAYREAALYRAGITGSDGSTRISIPTAESDVKYHYTQGLALHYLLTGDDRFREAAENVAVRMHDLWDPAYSGPSDFWTERHAGFALLAYEWAAAVSDDRASVFEDWAGAAVATYLPMLEVDAYAWDGAARCFAHHADAHGEPYGYVGCSPWMSAILADGLDAHARRVGGPAGAAVGAALTRLGRMIAERGRDNVGRPFYWMGAGVTSAEPDAYDEHWGESAYVVAMAWHWGGRSDPGLHTAALELVQGLRDRGVAGQLRSFNWQCRSSVMAPYFLR